MIIQRTLKEERVEIEGSNEVLDWPVNLCPIPFLGFHLGVLIASLGTIRDILRKYKKDEFLLLDGHSLGGAVCSVVAVILMFFYGYKHIHVETQGAVKAVSWWWAMIFRWMGGTSNHRVYGNDPVPHFWFWFF